MVPKLFLPTVRKNCTSDWEKLLKFEAAGREFAKNLRSLDLLALIGIKKHSGKVRKVW